MLVPNTDFISSRRCPVSLAKATQLVYEGTPDPWPDVEIAHVVLWKLKRPSALTNTSTEEVLAKAKEAINALKNVPGPESVHLGPPLLDARAKGFDYGTGSFRKFIRYQKLTM